MAFQIVNFLEVTLAAGVGSGDTSMVVLDADLSQLLVYDPALVLSLTIVGESSNEHEIVYVTARVGTTLTIQRGCDGTVARAHPAGSRVVAAMNKAVLAALLSAPTNAAAVAYTESSVIKGANVQQALDNTGELIIGAGLQPPVQAIPAARIPGETIGLASTSVQPFDLKAAGRITTDGLATVKNSNTVAIFPISGAKGVLLVLRGDTLGNLDYLDIQLRTNSTNYRTARVLATDLSTDQWVVLYLPASKFAQTGSVGAINDVLLKLKDDGTGTTTIDVHSIAVLDQSYKNLTVFRQISDMTQLNNLIAREELPAQFYAIIDYSLLGSVFTLRAIQMLSAAGIGIVVSSSLNYKAATVAQIKQNVFDILRTASGLGFSPVGLLYPGNYYGRLDLDATQKVYDVVSRYFERGFFGSKLLGESGQEFPELTPIYTATATENLTTLLASPFESRLLDLSAMTDSQFNSALDAVENAIRSNFVPPSDPLVASSINAVLSQISALSTTVSGKIARAGDRMDGPFSLEVVDHGTKGSVTEVFDFSLGNVHEVIVNGNLIIDPTNLQKGDSLQINAKLTSGSISIVSGKTVQWETPGGKSTSISATEVVLTPGFVYRIILEPACDVLAGVLK